MGGTNGWLGAARAAISQLGVYRLASLVGLFRLSRWLTRRKLRILLLPRLLDDR